MSAINPCNAQSPFVVLENNGTPPTLSYNVPQNVSFLARGGVKLNIPNNYFDPLQNEVPKNNPFQANKTIPQATVLQKINDQILGVANVKIIKNISQVGISKPLVINPPDPSNISSSPLTYAQHGISAQNLIADIPATEIAIQVTNGNLPYVSRNFYGQPIIKFISEPDKPQPQIIIVLYYKIATYPGSYGAGKTVKTFSLLPGEKTTISIETYRHDETLVDKASNVLDSFSKSSSDDLQQNIDNVTNSSTSNNNASNSALNWSVSAKGGVDIAVINASANANIGGTQADSINTAVSNQVQNTVDALNDHVNNSSSARQVNVNTETTTSTSTTTDQKIIRDLQNINLSRVLNFVFRQLMQEYITITYLDQVKIFYTNGYPDSNQLAELPDLDSFLNSVILNKDNINKVRTSICASLCNIIDYTDSIVSFIESVTKNIADCINDGTIIGKQTYIRKKKGLSQTFQSSSGKSFTVPGIILDVTTRVLPTESLVVDALLGQAEALDCYNTSLQQAAVDKANLANGVTKQQMNIIDGVNDPNTKPTLYKKVFGDCCDVPQSCCNCSDLANLNKSNVKSNI